jgi:hypothetical protein
MPTDIALVFARKRAVQTEITILLFCLIISLGLMFEFLT